MRLLSIFLLLLCILQAAADGIPPCDRSLIKGVDLSKIHYKSEPNTLTCVAGKDRLMAIEFNSTRYMSLTCDNTGWKAKRTKVEGKSVTVEYDKVAEALNPLNIACLEYCPVSGVGLDVDQRDNSDEQNVLLINCKYRYKYLGDYYSEQLFYGQWRIHDAGCVLNNDEVYWAFSLDDHGNEYVQREYSGRPEHFECRIDLPIAATNTEIANNNLIKPTPLANENTPSLDTMIPYDKDSLLKCSSSLIKIIDSSKVHFDNVTKRLICVGGESAPRAIKLEGGRYGSLTCDESEGWKAKKLSDDGKNWEYQTIGKPSDTLYIACVEYCAATGGIKFKQSNDFENNGEIEICCAAKYTYQRQKYSEALFYGQKQLLGASCSLEKEAWRLHFEQYDHPVDLIRHYGQSPVQFECKLVLPIPIAPTPVTTTTTTEDTTNVDSTVTIPITTTTTTPSTTGKPDENDSFAAAKSETQSSLIVVGCSVGGFVLGGIVVIVIFIIYRNLLLPNNNLPNNGKNVKAPEEGRKKNTKSNVEIPSDVDNSSSGR